MAHKKKKALRWLIPLALVALATGYFLFRPHTADVYVQATASTGDIRTTFSFTGNITAPHRQTLVAGGNATVRDIYVAANDAVRAGARLMKLSDGTLVKSDIGGEVVRLNVRVDGVVSAGDELATIMDVTRLEVEISIDEYDVAAVELGKEVEVTVNALDITCPGTIERFDKDARTAGNLSAYAAVVSIDAPEGVLPGMQVEVKMLDRAAENATLLAAEALQFDEANRAYVLTKSGAEYARTYVEVGISDGARVQILAGIQSGTVVYYTPGSDDVLMMMRMGGERWR